MANMLYLCLCLIIGRNTINCLVVRSFPKSFLFGASSSAYQIEGGWASDGKGPSIWDITTHTKPSPIEDESTGDIAADSYYLHNKDIEIIKDLGLDFYRFSVSWARIYPHGFPQHINQAGVNYYSQLIDDLISIKVKPFITIYHQDLPWNLQAMGGWTNPNIIEMFADYAKVLFDKFGNRVKHWVTLNDPKKICNDEDMDKFSMANTTGIATYLCTKNVLLAHARVYHMYDQDYRALQQGSVGIAIGFNWYEPFSDTLDDYQAAVDARQFEWGQFTHPIFSVIGDYPIEMKKNVASKSAEQGFTRSRLTELSALETAMIRGSADFLGMNSYSTALAYRDASLEGLYPVPSSKDDASAVTDKDPSWHQSELPWLHEVPWGFFKLLLEVKNLYGNPPVYVLENGWASKGGLLDEDRVSYIRGYLTALLDALEEGCDVRAYAVWSLMDNFEWINGYTKKFGLYEVDFKSSDKTRTPRKSAFIYKEIIRSRTLDPLFEPETFIVDTETTT